MKDRIINLLIKKKLEALSLEEHAELNRLLAENKLAENVSQTLDGFWEEPIPYKENPAKKVDADKLWNRVQQKIDQPDVIKTRQKSYNWFKITGIAASLFLVMGLAFFYLENPKNESDPTNVVVTKKGSKSFVILPDGSKVWINNDSKLFYTHSFNQKTREVTLVGEAYFDVVKDKTRPFIVHTDHADVQVLGTAFNVKAYANAATTETTLLRGAVELILKGKDPKKIALIPNQKLIINNRLPDNTLNRREEIVLFSVKKQPGDTLSSETQWINNKLTFDQEQLEDIVPVLERWYDVKIKMRIPKMDKKITGTFENRTITDVLDAIQFAGGFKYKISNGNQIIIYK